MAKIEIIQGDITRIAVDAIVNAANSSLMGGGGVDGAIHRAGGPQILEECRKIVARQGGCPTGEAVITTAGRLPSKYVIHTVGPVWRGGNSGEHNLLASCYTSSIKLAAAHQCNAIAFPNISTGVYGFPKNEAAQVAIETVHTTLQQESSVSLIIMVCFDAENFELLQMELERFRSK